jgi:hypothetical protein
MVNTIADELTLHAQTNSSIVGLVLPESASFLFFQSPFYSLLSETKRTTRVLHIAHRIASIPTTVRRARYSERSTHNELFSACSFLSAQPPQIGARRMQTNDWKIKMQLNN